MTARLRLPGSIAEVEASQKGPDIGAFFDMDGTLVAGHTGNYISKERIRRGELGSSEILRSVALMAINGMTYDVFVEMLELGGAAWRGRAHEDLLDMGRKVFERDIRSLVYPEMREIVAAHRNRGHTVVLSSAASDYQVMPTAEHLGIEHVLCNTYLTEDGVLTGQVRRPVLFGPGKAHAVQEFATGHGIDLTRSYFYADGDEDVALMYLVGHPRPTNPGKALARVAEKRGWPILGFDKPEPADPPEQADQGSNGPKGGRFGLPGKGLSRAQRILGGVMGSTQETKQPPSD